MKKILSLFILSGLIVFNACDPMEDIYNEIDAQDDPIVTAIEYLLTSDDYKTIAGLAEDADATDTINADFISSFKYFTDDIKAEDYVALFLNDRYPVQGPGSTAKITYNYNGEMPEDLTMYASATEFEFDVEAYEEVDSLVAFAGYFYPAFEPDVFLPDVLATLITDAEKGDLYRINYLYSDVTPIFPETATVEILSEDFELEADGLGAFDSISIAGDDQKWYWSSYGGNTYAKMSGYSGGAQENEDWLVSPSLSLSSDVSIILNINQAINYLNDSTYQLDILISTDYSGDVTLATWSSIKEDVNMPVGDSWDFVESGNVNISDFAGESINLAFKYTSSTNNAATWEIAEVVVIEGERVVGAEPFELNDMYEFSNGMWVKSEDVYYLNALDYDAMGDPGENDRFSSSAVPQDYIPKYLDNKRPTAGEGVSVIVVYKYYTDTDAGTVTVADEYTYTAGVWKSSYAYVQEVTAQWAVSSSSNKWVFDPTETITLTNDEYKYIVDYVIANFDAEFVGYDSRREYYYGVSEKYNNFDITSGKYNEEEFDSWDEAAATALSDVLLPYLYPNATLQVNGVDMYYKVIFNTYSGSASTYAMKFQVTKAGPDPEFTLTEGPILQ